MPTPNLLNPGNDPYVDERLRRGLLNLGTAFATGGPGGPGDIAQGAISGATGLLNAQMNAIDPTGRVRAMSGQMAPLQSYDVPYTSENLQRGLGGDPEAPESLLGFIGAPDITDVAKIFGGLAMAPAIVKSGRNATESLLGNYATTTPGRIRNKTEKEGGYTVSLLTGEEPQTGLFVGKYKNTDPRNKVLDGPITKSDLEGFVQTNDKALQRIENHLGTWKEGASGKTYIDVSQRFEPDELRKATKFGERTNQIAGFNRGTFEEFPIGNWDEFIHTPEFAGRMDEMRKVGQDYLKAHPTDEWWDIHGTLFEEVYGKDNLEALAGYIAATAPNTNPTQNVRMASEYMRRHLLGEDIIQPDWRVPAGTQTRTEGVQIGMEAGRKNNLLAASEGRVDDLQSDKVRHEAKALLGDPDAAVFDRWWARIAEDAKKGVYTSTQEGAFERAKKTYNQYDELYKVVRSAAEEQGRTVRDFSADVWTGIRETVKNTDQLFGAKYKGSALTGESKGYADIFDDLVESKARFLGISVDKFKDRLSKGDAELLTLIIGAPLGAHAFAQMRAGDSEISHKRDGRHLNGLL
jgi:hypothetical protein